MTLIRIVSFCVVVILGFTFPLWSFVGVAALYAFFFTPYELVVLGVLIDAYFGSAPGGYTYTLITAGMLVVSVYLRPRLSFYA